MNGNYNFISNKCNYPIEMLHGHLKTYYFSKIPNPQTDLQLEAQKMHACYDHARNSSFLLIGKKDLRFDFSLWKNLGSLSLIPHHKEEEIRDIFQRLYPLSICNQAIKNHLHHGSIIDDAEWSILKNDLFILGNIHAGHEVHLGHIPTKEKIWNFDKGRPKVLGREIFMLCVGGYTPYQSQEEVIFIPEKETQKCLYLPEMTKKIEALTSPDTILDYMARTRPFEPASLYKGDCYRW